ncbi:hypothetical protein [Aeromicrobium duanguangcaii]|uniref:hypothetical protein n=1 Tax=Aeromicrobium duanguangcaii TaxID=2968086 RepID=UPI002017E366|nr:hypothetical protein [Aeromicrobium duanguangcaii]MCL3838868.1 hypothetical protein [Aeromicrobium duanguangcaii]
MPHPSFDRADSCGPRLLPGALLLRRDARTLQVGTSPGVLVRDRPGLARLLRLLDGSLSVDRLRPVVERRVPEFTDDLGATLARLIASGAVIAPEPALHSPTVAVRHDRSSSAFAGLLVDGFGSPPDDPDLEILVSAGEPARSAFEDLVTAGVVHLPVVLDERRVRIGPLVAPGDTPCLGCLDAQLTTADPAWAALLPQFERVRLLPQALPLWLLHRAAAEVMRQVDCLRRGLRPPAVGHVVSVGSEAPEVEVCTVPFATTCVCRLLAA